jgi:hypothetical protein
LNPFAHDLDRNRYSPPEPIGEQGMALDQATHHRHRVGLVGHGCLRTIAPCALVPRVVRCQAIRVDISC